MELVKIKRKNYNVEKLLKEDSVHKTSLCSFKDKKFVIKTFANIDSFKKEIKDFKAISKYGIIVPKLLKTDKKNLSILYQYVGEETVLDIIEREDVCDAILDKLFNMYRFARFSKIDLDYLPENYKFYNNELYYVSYEFHEQKAETNLENYGIRYWVYTKDLAEHLKEFGKNVDQKRILNNADANKKIVLLSILRW